MTVFPATKGASLSSVHVVCAAVWFYTWVRVLVLKMWLLTHVTSLPETQEESKNIFTKENDKNYSNAQLEYIFRLIIPFFSAK